MNLIATGLGVAQEGRSSVVLVGVFGGIVVVFDVLAASASLDNHAFKFHRSDEFHGGLMVVEIMQPLALVFFY